VNAGDDLLGRPVQEWPVERIMTPAPVCLDAGCTVGGALSFLATHRHGAAPVVDARGRLLGTVPRASLLALVHALRERLGPKGTVADLLAAPMEPAVERVQLRCSRGTTLREACMALATHHDAALLIEDGEHLVGILTLRDVARAVAFVDEPPRPDWRAGQGRGYDALPETFFPADHELMRQLMAPSSGTAPVPEPARSAPRPEASTADI
jgi:CBS domain-containing protein